MLIVPMSASSWIYNLVQQRKKVNVVIYGYDIERKVSMFYMSFQNQSRLPISITRISLVTDDRLVDCITIPMDVLDIASTMKSTEQYCFFTEKIPIDIPSLGSVSGYIAFASNEPLLPPDATTVSLVIHTNRGSLGKRKLRLNEEPLPSQW